MAKNKIQTEKQKSPLLTGSKRKIQKEPLQHKWRWIFAILLLTYLSYFTVSTCGFTTWDDPLYVTESNLIKKLSLENIGKMFSAAEEVALNYHPVTIITLAIDYHFAKLNPSTYHSTNLLIHLLNTLLVFFFAYRLSGRKIFVGVFVSLFFGIHPMHVESVAWISERKDVLYTFFFMAGLLSYMKYYESSKYKYLIFTFLLFVLSVLSKAVAVVFPLVMFLLDYYKGRKFDPKTIMEKVPFLVISVIFGLLAVKIQSQQAIASYETFSVIQRIGFGFYGNIMYLVKLFFPFHLSSFYPYPIAEGKIVYPFEFYLTSLAGILFFMATLFLFFIKEEKSKLFAFGMGFYFVTIVLVLQFISVGQVIMADRYSYVPFIGLLFPIAIIINDYTLRKPSMKDGLYIFIFIIALVFSYLTYDRIKIWKDTETLWTDVIVKYPFPPWLVEPAFTARGKYYAVERKDMDKALSDYDKLIQMKTKNHFVYNNLGNIYGTKGAEAEKSGNISLAKEYYDKCISYFETSLSLDSTDGGTYVNRGTAYVYMKKYDLAAADFDKALKDDPQNLSLVEKRAFCNFESHKWKEAIADYNKLISVDASKSYMFLYRGKARMKTSMIKGAIEDFNLLIQREPKDANAYYNLAFCNLQLNDFVEAHLNLEKSKQLGNTSDPDHIEILLKSVSNKK